MKNLYPRTLKFKKIDVSDLVLEQGLTTNRHWIFKTEWFLGLSEETTKLGFKNLKAKVIQKQIETVKERLQASTRDVSYKLGVSQVFEKLKGENTDLKEVSRANVIFYKGYVGRKFQETYISFESNKAPFIDIGYAPILFFDNSTRIFVSEKNPMAPCFLKDSKGEFIAALAPLNPNRILKGDL